MNHNYLIGLGGSGGKIISELYTRLIKERGEDFDKEVTCIAIDTDQGELDELAQLGVKQVCISGSGNVGQFFNNLGDDVDEWCPNTANEGNFFSSQLHDGASQCRLKSRLCLANFLKDRNNALASALEEALIPTSDVKVTSGEAPITVLIASSIAGGTGSGIFIQVALYVKKFFREHNIQNVKIKGIFACPDLYKKVVPAENLTSLYSNAYAVIRELNAFNLICGAETKTAYGGKLDIDIEISTSCEGKLFEKDAEGRYGDKPYDALYFIDKVNYLSKILGGLPEYYKAMANIAYSLLYTDIATSVHSSESNEMNARNVAPNAIYASAGASSIVYPYEDIMKYFANRSIAESFDSVWTVIDREWESYCRAKDADARAKGMTGYVPAEGEREAEYIRSFDKHVKPTALTKNEMSFLSSMVHRDDVPVVDALLSVIADNAKAAVQTDDRIVKEKVNHYISNLEQTQSDVIDNITTSGGDDDNSAIFQSIADIDAKLKSYCEKCITYVVDMSVAFANNIICTDKTLWNYYDESEFGVIKNLLCNKKEDGDVEWIHPVAARYLLYTFSQKIKQKISDFRNAIEDTPGDDVSDYVSYLEEEIVNPHMTMLSNNDENQLSNVGILYKRLEKFWGSKKTTIQEVENYFENLEEELESIENVFADALLYFSYLQVYERVSKLISEYEVFFDNIGEFIKKANSAVNAYENMHDNSRGVLYVCAGSEIKKKMYDDIAKHINLKTGETASIISHGLFESLRTRAVSGTKGGTGAKNAGIASFFENVSDVVTESSKKSTEINGKVDKNVFQAMLYEYAVANPEDASDEAEYSDDKGAENRINAFISSKLNGAAKMAAPLLVYDSKDTYSGMMDNEEDDYITKQARSVTHVYRHISHNDEVAESICALSGSPVSNGNVSGFYTGFISDLPKDTENQSIYLTYVDSDKVDRYTMLFYSTVHCLQPYQIKAFDEVHGGVYYEYYSKRISEMEKVQRYSMTPHLDKRWHKHGTMPYINVAKEIERRLDLAKAFLYALCYGKIGYFVEGSDVSIAYSDLKLKRAPEKILYKGKFVPYSKINRAMNWLANREELIEIYSAQFDRLIENEIETLSKYDATVGGYKAGITNFARILNQLKRKIIRPVEVKGSRSGKAVKTKELEPICIFDLAWNLHTSEENDVDKNYAELLVETLCGILKKYSKAPYNAEDIEKKAEGSEAYMNYKDVLNHLVKAFKDEYAVALSKKRKEELILDEGEDVAAEEEPAKKEYFGRSSEDLVDEDEDTTGSALRGSAVLQDRRMKWLNSCISSYFENDEEIDGE